MFVSQARHGSKAASNEVEDWLAGRLAWEQRLAFLERTPLAQHPTGPAAPPVLQLVRVHTSGRAGWGMTAPEDTARRSATRVRRV